MTKHQKKTRFIFQNLKFQMGKAEKLKRKDIRKCEECTQVLPMTAFRKHGSGYTMICRACLDFPMCIVCEEQRVEQRKMKYCESCHEHISDYAMKLHQWYRAQKANPAPTTPQSAIQPIEAEPEFEPETTTTTTAPQPPPFDTSMPPCDWPSFEELDQEWQQIMDRIDPPPPPRYPFLHPSLDEMFAQSCVE
jgi:hypothetical protein